MLYEKAAKDMLEMKIQSFMKKSEDLYGNPKQSANTEHVSNCSNDSENR